MLGPFYFRTEKDGTTRGAFVPEGRHANGGGIVHGGALMSFADTMLRALAYIGLNGQLVVTVTFNCEFVGAGVAGTPIHATGRIVRDTKSMVFVRAELEQSEQQFINAISHVAGPLHKNDKGCESDLRTTEQRLADGLVQLCDAYAKGQVTGGRERATILITIPVDGFTGDSDEAGTTAHGDRIPAHIVRRLAENANLQRIMQSGSRILDLGRSVRYASDDHYKALVARDGGCRWPGCHIPAAWCEIDHLTAYTEGGPTDLDNLAMWCSHHHHEKHRSGVKVHGNTHNLRLTLANGSIIDCPTQHQRRTPAAA